MNLNTDSAAGSYFGSYLFVAAAVILVSALMLITTLFFIRIVKAKRLKRIEKMKQRFQRILNKIIVHEHFDANRPFSPSFEFYLAELRLELNASKRNRQVLTRQIIDIKKSLSGASAWILIATYMELGLHKDSIGKLSARAWEENALGIRELAEMQCAPAADLVLPFLQSRNEVLHQESFMALVKMQGSTLSFLDSYQGFLTKWMQINIHQHLSRIDIRRLPSFRRWFHVSNKSVRCFSITMAYQFRQTSAVPDLMELLGDEDPEIVALATEALGELESFESSGEVVKILRERASDEMVLVSCLRCLARIGDPERDGAGICAFLSHPSYNIRYEAIAALKKLGPSGDRLLAQMRGRTASDIERLDKHFSDPLILN